MSVSEACSVRRAQRTSSNRSPSAVSGESLPSATCGAQQRASFRSQGKTMNDDGMLIQGPGPPEVENLLCGLLIDAFCQMDEERLTFWSVPLLPCGLRFERQGVSPSVVSEDSYDKVFGKHQGFKRIV